MFNFHDTYQGTAEYCAAFTAAAQIRTKPAHSLSEFQSQERTYKYANILSEAWKSAIDVVFVNTTQHTHTYSLTRVYFSSVSHSFSIKYLKTTRSSINQLKKFINHLNSVLNI